MHSGPPPPLSARTRFSPVRARAIDCNIIFICAHATADGTARTTTTTTTTETEHGAILVFSSLPGTKHTHAHAHAHARTHAPNITVTQRTSELGEVNLPRTFRAAKRSAALRERALKCYGLCGGGGGGGVADSLARQTRDARPARMRTRPCQCSCVFVYCNEIYVNCCGHGSLSQYIIKMNAHARTHAHTRVQKRRPRAKSRARGAESQQSRGSSDVNQAENRPDWTYKSIAFRIITNRSVLWNVCCSNDAVFMWYKHIIFVLFAHPFVVSSKMEHTNNTSRNILQYYYDKGKNASQGGLEPLNDRLKKWMLYGDSM